MLWEFLKSMAESYLRWEMADAAGRCWTFVPVFVLVCLLAICLICQVVELIIFVVSAPRKIHFRVVFSVWPSRSGENTRTIQERVDDVLGTKAMDLKRLFDKQNSLYNESPSLEKTNGLLRLSREIRRAKAQWTRLVKLVKGCGFEAKKTEDYWPKERIR
jgi:hypothetical protein